MTLSDRIKLRAHVAATLMSGLLAADAASSTLDINIEFIVAQAGQVLDEVEKAEKAAYEERRRKLFEEGK